MSQYYYVDAQGQQAGPVDASQLLACGVTAQTFVWTAGMANWTPACQVAELVPLFQVATPPNPRPVGLPNPNPNPNGVPNPYTPYPQPVGQAQKPNDYLVFSILVTLFCCLIGGVVAIVNSTGSRSAYAAGDYDTAVKKANTAKTWCIVSAVIGLVTNVLYFSLLVSETL